MFNEQSFLARINASDRITAAKAGSFLRFRVRRVSPTVFDVVDANGKQVLGRNGQALQKRLVTTSLWDMDKFNSANTQALLTAALEAQDAGKLDEAHKLFQSIENSCSMEYSHILDDRSLPVNGTLMQGTVRLHTGKNGTQLVVDGVSIVPSEVLPPSAKMTSLRKTGAAAAQGQPAVTEQPQSFIADQPGLDSTPALTAEEQAKLNAELGL